MGLHDLNRLDLKKGAVYEGLDCQRKRIRIARLETLPNKDAELVSQLRMTLNAVRRLGRPIHVFRGSPRRDPGIFHSDALPPWLERLLGGDSLRIEQLPEALHKLELFENIANSRGLGIEWAKQLADPATRLGALCVAWAMAIDSADGSGRDRAARAVIETRTREQALAIIRTIGGDFSEPERQSRTPWFGLLGSGAESRGALAARVPRSTSSFSAGRLRTGLLSQRRLAPQVEDTDRS